jgi:hypothetical protein
MLIHRIFHRPRIESPSTRARRSSRGLCFPLESLENRTPLSSGLGAAIEVPVAARAVELASYNPRPPVLLDWISLGASGSGEATANVPSQIVVMNASPSVSAGAIPALSLAREMFQSDRPVGDMVSSTNPMAGPGASAALEMVQAQPQLAAGGRIAELLPNLLPGQEGIPGDGRLVDAAPTFHSEDGSDAPPISQPPGPFMTMALLRGGTPTNGNDGGNADMIYAGSLESIEMDDGFSAWTATPLVPGRAPGYALSFVVTEPSLQLDSNGEGINTSGPSYLATGGWSTLYSEQPASAVDDVLTWDDGSIEPILPGSITTGGVSLNILLSGPDMPIRKEPVGLAQVVELVPLQESSLALAAALWTVPSDSPASFPGWNLSAGKATQPGGRRASASSWALFVTGLDQALEQTSRDIREGLHSRGSRRADNEAPPGGPDELLHWQGPILPASQGESPESQPKSPRTGRRTTTDETVQGILPTQQDSRPHSENGQPIVLGMMPMVSVVSMASLIAGWFWRKHQRARSLPRACGSRP